MRLMFIAIGCLLLVAVAPATAQPSETDLTIHAPEIVWMCRDQDDATIARFQCVLTCVSDRGHSHIKLGGVGRAEYHAAGDRWWLFAQYERAERIRYHLLGATTTCDHVDASGNEASNVIWRLETFAP